MHLICILQLPMHLGVHYLATVASFLQGLAEIKCSSVLQPTFSLSLVLQLYLSLGSFASRLSLQKKEKKKKWLYWPIVHETAWDKQNLDT